MRLPPKYAFPDRAVIALLGDGAMQMNGLNELITVSKYWREWADPRLVIAVLNNRDLNLVTWEQRLAGQPKFDATQDLPDVAYADFARSLGLHGYRVETPDAVSFAWDDALAADRPTVLDFVVDPNVPPLPPHITVEQARAFLTSLWAGDAARAGLIKQTIKQVAEAFLPHRS